MGFEPVRDAWAVKKSALSAALGAAARSGVVDDAAIKALVDVVGAYHWPNFRRIAAHLPPGDYGAVQWVELVMRTAIDRGLVYFAGGSGHAGYWLSPAGFELMNKGG